MVCTPEDRCVRVIESIYTRILFPDNIEASDDYVNHSVRLMTDSPGRISLNTHPYDIWMFGFRMHAQYIAVGSVLALRFPRIISYLSGLGNGFGRRGGK